MCEAEGEQGQAVQYPRDAQTLVAGGETEALPAPVTGEPGIQNPGGRRHHQGVTAAPPRIQHSRSTEEIRHPEQQQPAQEIDEQRAGTLLGTPDHVGVKSPWIRPKIPRATMVAAKTAWPKLAMPIALAPVLFQLIRSPSTPTHSSSSELRPGPLRDGSAANQLRSARTSGTMGTALVHEPRRSGAGPFCRRLDRSRCLAEYTPLLFPVRTGYNDIKQFGFRV